MMINAIILGQTNVDPEKCKAAGNIPTHPDCIDSKDYVAAFGIGSATMSIVLLATGLCFTLGLQQVIPQAYGAKQYELCGAYLNRMLIVVTVIFVPFLIPIQFIYYFFKLINQSDQVSE